MDSLTKEGVPWFLPLPYKFGFPPLRKFRIITGKLMENTVVFPIIIVILIWLCASHYEQLTTLIQQHIIR